MHHVRPVCRDRWCTTDSESTHSPSAAHTSGWAAVKAVQGRSAPENRNTDMLRPTFQARCWQPAACRICRNQDDATGPPLHAQCSVMTQTSGHCLSTGTLQTAGLKVQGHPRCHPTLTFWQSRARSRPLMSSWRAATRAVITATSTCRTEQGLSAPACMNRLTQEVLGQRSTKGISWWQACTGGPLSITHVTALGGGEGTTTQPAWKAAAPAQCQGTQGLPRHGCYR